MDKREEKDCKEISLYLDRIEELEDDTKEAVLLLDDDEEGDLEEIFLPESLLPENISEGDYLTMKIYLDEEKTSNALNEARRLLEDLKE